MTPTIFNVRHGSPEDFRKFGLKNPDDSYRLRVKGDLLYLVPSRSKNYLHRVIAAMTGITAHKRVNTAEAVTHAFARTLHPGAPLAATFLRNALLDQLQTAGLTAARTKSRAQCLMDHDIKVGMLKAALNRAQADIFAFEAFGTTMADAMENMRQSNVFEAAQGSRTGSMTQHTLEGELRQMLKDPRARRMIRQCRLSPEEAVAIRFYGRQGYQDVQQALRSNDELTRKAFDSLVQACRDGFAKLPSLPPTVTTLYRCEDYLNGNRKGTIEGDGYTDPAFVSTSVFEHVARNRFGGHFLLKIDVSDGAACRDVSVLTGNLIEAEVLFLPGTRYRLVSRQVIGKVGNDGVGEIVQVRPA